MNESISIKPVAKKQTAPLVKIIIYAWLLVGTLDIAAAVVQSIVNGGKPIRMLQFIASGVFGKQAFSGGVAVALYGLLFHYCITFIWTALFFKIYSKLNLVNKNWILTGIVYGIFVWMMMNLVVMPLSATPPIKFPLVKTIISMLIIMVAIGLPLSFIANKFFSRNEQAKKLL